MYTGEFFFEGEEVSEFFFVEFLWGHLKGCHERIR